MPFDYLAAQIMVILDFVLVTRDQYYHVLSFLSLLFLSDVSVCCVQSMYHFILEACQLLESDVYQGITGERVFENNRRGPPSVTQYRLYALLL